ncbi:MAG: glycosyltransferase family 4 protein, partial [Chloroflexi bacterium]|nr:glycosyltransferase family 4 protein [Chloroflexota bacterium]
CMLIEQYGALPSSRVIANGRDPKFFRTLAKQDFVLTAGRVWDEAKNIYALDQVAPHLPWRIYVAGEPKHPEGGVAPTTHLRALGHLSPHTLARWYGGAAIFALPARYEPFGLSALEAGLAGCALVLGDIPSLRDVWGDAALFVPPDDTEMLTKVLRQLIANPAQRKSLAQRARRRALAYLPQRMGAGYLAAYSELLASRKPPTMRDVLTGAARA